MVVLLHRKSLSQISCNIRLSPGSFSVVSGLSVWASLKAWTFSVTVQMPSPPSLCLRNNTVALFREKFEPSSCYALKNSPQRLEGHLKGLAMTQCVIKVHITVATGDTQQHPVHQPLEGGWWVTETKRKCCKLPAAPASTECCFQFNRWGERLLTVSRPKAKWQEPWGYWKLGLWKLWYVNLLLGSGHSDCEGLGASSFRLYSRKTYGLRVESRSGAPEKLGKKLSRGWAILTEFPSRKHIGASARVGQQPVTLRKSNPRMQGSWTGTTHTGWRIVLPPTTIINIPLGDNSPITMCRWTNVGSRTVYLGSMFSHTSVTVELVSTSAKHATPSIRTGTWHRSHIKVRPTITTLSCVAMSAGVCRDLGFMFRKVPLGMKSFPAHISFVLCGFHRVNCRQVSEIDFHPVWF